MDRLWTTTDGSLDRIDFKFLDRVIPPAPMTTRRENLAAHPDKNYAQWVNERLKPRLLRKIKKARTEKQQVQRAARLRATKRVASAIESSTVALERVFGIQDHYMRTYPTKNFLRVQGYLLMRDEDMSTVFAKFSRDELDLMFREAAKFAEKLSARWAARAATDKKVILQAIKTWAEQVERKKEQQQRELARLRTIARVHPHADPESVRAAVRRLQLPMPLPAATCGSKTTREYLMTRLRMYVQVCNLHKDEATTHLFIPAGAKSKRPCLGTHNGKTFSDSELLEHVLICGARVSKNSKNSKNIEK
eukprot:SAG31_NODE_10924_length_1082_cov_2.265514_2_plen_306_part_01